MREATVLVVNLLTGMSNGVPRGTYLPTLISGWQRSLTAVVFHRISGISELFDSQPSRASFIPNAQLMTVPRLVTLLQSTVELTIKDRAAFGRHRGLEQFKWRHTSLLMDNQ